MKEGCVVTGVAGFVGSHLTQRLLEMGHPVAGVDNFFSGRPDNMASFRNHPLFTFYNADIREPNLLPTLKSNHPDLGFCFHLAAIVSVPWSMEHTEETMEVNHDAALHLLSKASLLGFKVFVFAGSAAEYGDDERVPLQEEYATGATRHLSPYGRSKFLTSREVAADQHGVALRFFNIYGPRQDPSSPYSGVISRFIDMARNSRAVTIFGDGRQTRDFIHVSDVVEAYIRAAGIEEKNKRVPHGIYNIGTGTSTTILQLFALIRKIWQSSAGVEFLPERSGDIRHSTGATDRFREATGWKPNLPLEEGLRRMAAEGGLL